MTTDNELHVEKHRHTVYTCGVGSPRQMKDDLCSPFSSFAIGVRRCDGMDVSKIRLLRRCAHEVPLMIDLLLERDEVLRRCIPTVAVLRLKTNHRDSTARCTPVAWVSRGR